MNIQQDDLGELVILKLNKLDWDTSLEGFLRLSPPGGVVIDSPLAGGAEAVFRFLNKVVDAIRGVPFLAIEEEGGSVDPLRAFLPPLPAPRVAAEKGLPVVRRLGELMGAASQAAGFNTILAPSLDLASPAAEGTLATRAFSSDPQQVARCGEAFLSGLERHKVLACGMLHFPFSISYFPSE